MLVVVLEALISIFLAVVEETFSKGLIKMHYRISLVLETTPLIGTLWGKIGILLCEPGMDNWII